MGVLLSSLLGKPNEELPADWDVPDEATGLSPRQKRAVKDSWALVQPELRATGVAVLLALFQEHPEHKNIFVTFKDISSDELRNNKKFVAHASSVMHAIASLVDALDDTECLVELLTKIGENHKKRNVPKQAFTDLKNVIVKLLKAKLGKQLSTDAEEAWDKTLTVANSIIWQQLEDKE